MSGIKEEFHELKDNIHNKFSELKKDNQDRFLKLRKDNLTNTNAISSATAQKLRKDNPFTPPKNCTSDKLISWFLKYLPTR